MFYKILARWQQKPSRSASSPWRTSSKKISSDSAWSQTLPAAPRPGTSSFTQFSLRWEEAYFSAETACLLRFSVLIAFRCILSNFSPPTPLSRTQVWIDVNFLLGCYWLLDMIWARRSNTSENSVSFSITTFSCLNYAEPIFLQEFDIRKVRLKVFGVKYHSSAQQAHRPRQTQLTKYYF